MRIVFLAADDPLYLPAFFETVLRERARDTVEVDLVPPLYRSQTAGSAALRYARTFGFADAARLAWRIAAARIAGQSIATVCRAAGVACRDVPDVHAPVNLDRLRAALPDLLVSVSSPQIFRAPLLALPALGTLNVHGAMLPRYRGVLPAFWMLANGERQAGVSIHFMNEDLDSGDLCGQEAFDVLPAESLDAFLRRSKAVAAQLLLRTLTAIEEGTVTRRPLDVSGGSYYSWPARPDVLRFRATGRRVW